MNGTKPLLPRQEMMTETEYNAAVQARVRAAHGIDVAVLIGCASKDVLEDACVDIPLHQALGRPDLPAPTTPNDSLGETHE